MTDWSRYSNPLKERFVLLVGDDPDRRFRVASRHTTLPAALNAAAKYYPKVAPFTYYARIDKSSPSRGGFTSKNVATINVTEGEKPWGRE